MVHYLCRGSRVKCVFLDFMFNFCEVERMELSFDKEESGLG